MRYEQDRYCNHVIDRTNVYVLWKRLTSVQERWEFEEPSNHVGRMKSNWNECMVEGDHKKREPQEQVELWWRKETEVLGERNPLYTWAWGQVTWKITCKELATHWMWTQSLERILAMCPGPGRGVMEKRWTRRGKRSLRYPAYTRAWSHLLLLLWDGWNKYFINQRVESVILTPQLTTSDISNYVLIAASFFESFFLHHTVNLHEEYLQQFDFRGKNIFSMALWWARSLI